LRHDERADQPAVTGIASNDPIPSHARPDDPTASDQPLGSRAIYRPRSVRRLADFVNLRDLEYDNRRESPT
jgi:hypothetical protein